MFICWQLACNFYFSILDQQQFTSSLNNVTAMNEEVNIFPQVNQDQTYWEAD
jgi:hypothetical protein